MRSLEWAAFLLALVEAGLHANSLLLFAPLLQCQACWAFAPVAAIESKIFISTNTTNASILVDLSEQQVLDCASLANGYSSKGCAGGYLSDTFIYAARCGGNVVLVCIATLAV